MADRESDRKLARRVGAWGIANVIRQSLGISSLEARRRYGDAAEATKLLEEVPFGGVVNINPPSNGAAKLLRAGVLAVAAAAGGYLLASQAKPGATSTPRPPIDAVLEWELTDAGNGSE